MARRLGYHVWRNDTVDGKRVSWCENCGRQYPTDKTKAGLKDCRGTAVL